MLSLCTLGLGTLGCLASLSPTFFAASSKILANRSSSFMSRLVRFLGMLDLIASVRSAAAVVIASAAETCGQVIHLCLNTMVSVTLSDLVSGRNTF